jgi:hypothetical protein
LSTGTPWEVITRGNYAYVADEYAGLAILSIEDPRELVEVSYLTTGCFHRLEIAGNEVYLVGHDRLSIISVSDPFHPEEVGYYHSAERTKWDVRVEGSYIYATDGSNGLTVYEYYGPTSVADEEDTVSALPKTFALGQNYPNPFNPSTIIPFDVSSANGLDQFVSLRIYDIRGRLTTTLVSDTFSPGRHTITWNGENSRGESVGSGAYLATMQCNGGSLSRKVVLLR